MDRLFLVSVQLPSTDQETDTKPISNRRQQAIALVFCVATLGCFAWFWSEQISDVIEMLELAYPDDL